MSEADKPKTREAKAREAKTPLPEPYDGEEAGAPADREGSPVDTDAPTSTDERGKPMDLPNLGGKID